MRRSLARGRENMRCVLDKTKNMKCVLVMDVNRESATDVC